MVHQSWAIPFLSVTAAPPNTEPPPWTITPTNVAAARAGIGLATLPCGIADLEPGLVRVAELPESFTLDLWLLTHEDLRRSARIRAFLDFMAEALAREAPLLEGAEPRAGRAAMVTT